MNLEAIVDDVSDDLYPLRKSVAQSFKQGSLGGTYDAVIGFTPQQSVRTIHKSARSARDDPVDSSAALSFGHAVAAYMATSQMPDRAIKPYKEGIQTSADLMRDYIFRQTLRHQETVTYLAEAMRDNDAADTAVTALENTTNT